jgi:hypothetical protein
LPGLTMDLKAYLLPTNKITNGAISVIRIPVTKLQMYANDRSPPVIGQLVASSAAINRLGIKK